jgi:hypothetical protein
MFRDPISRSPDEAVFELALGGSQGEAEVSDRVDVFKRAAEPVGESGDFERQGLLPKSLNLETPKSPMSFAAAHIAVWKHALRIDQGYLEIEIKPVRGRAMLCAAVLEPIKLDQPEPVVRKRHESERAIAAVTAIDLDRRTRWAVEGDGQWIQYDLARPRLVTGLALAWFSGDQRRARFDIQASEDAKDWKQVFSGQSSGVTSSLEPVDFAGVRARYVRILCHGNSQNAWNSITEAAIHGQ